MSAVESVQMRDIDYGVLHDSGKQMRDIINTRISVVENPVEKILDDETFKMQE